MRTGDQLPVAVDEPESVAGIMASDLPHGAPGALGGALAGSRDLRLAGGPAASGGGTMVVIPWGLPAGGGYKTGRLLELPFLSRLW